MAIANVLSALRAFADSTHIDVIEPDRVHRAMGHTARVDVKASIERALTDASDALGRDLTHTEAEAVRGGIYKRAVALGRLARLGKLARLDAKSARLLDMPHPGECTRDRLATRLGRTIPVWTYVAPPASTS